MEPVGAGSGAGRGVSRQLYCRAVAVRGFSDVSRISKLDFRDQQFSLFRSPWDALGNEYFRADGNERRRLLDADGCCSAYGSCHD